MFTQKKCCLCSCSFSLSLQLIFTLLAANISHFLTTAIKSSRCVSHEVCLLCFLSLALSLSSTSAQTSKFSLKIRMPKMTVARTSIIKLNNTCRFLKLKLTVRTERAQSRDCQNFSDVWITIPRGLRCARESSAIIVFKVARTYLYACWLCF